MSSNGLRSGRRRQRNAPSQELANACIDLTVDLGMDEVIDLTHYHSNIMDSPVVMLSASDDVGTPGARNRRRRRPRGIRSPYSRNRQHEDISVSPVSINAPSSSNSDPVDVDASDRVQRAVIRRRMGSGRRGPRRSNSSGRPRQDISSIPMPSSSSAGTVDLDNSDDDLPDIPFNIPTPSAEANTSYIQFQSPALKISCPVCLDDLKQIKSSKRRIMSTICGHIFCEECITGAIRSLKSCPSCRHSLTLSKIHPIFL